MTELVCEQGYQETTVAQVTERAGVSADAFEALFGADLAGCLLAAENAILAKCISAISSTYSADRPEWESTILGTREILELMSAHPSLAHLGYIVSRQMGTAQVSRVYQSGIQVVAAMLDRAREYSDIDVAPYSAARGALGGPEAVIRREIAAGRGEELPKLLPDFVYAAAVPFLGQREALRLHRWAQDLLEAKA